jgi:hypothetical protein
MSFPGLLSATQSNLLDCFLHVFGYGGHGRLIALISLIIVIDCTSDDWKLLLKCFQYGK